MRHPFVSVIMKIFHFRDLHEEGFSGDFVGGKLIVYRSGRGEVQVFHQNIQRVSSTSRTVHSIEHGRHIRLFYRLENFDHGG